MFRLEHLCVCEEKGVKCGQLRQQVMAAVAGGLRPTCTRGAGGGRGGLVGAENPAKP